MVFVLDPFQKLQIFPVFPVTLMGVPGEAAVQRQDHKTVGKRCQDQVGSRIPHKKIDKAKGKADTDNECI